MNTPKQKKGEKITELENTPVPMPEPVFIPDDIKPILKNLPKEQQKTLLVALSVKRTWVGPIPPPEILEGYNHAIPNGADRILKMAENQSEHRISLEKNVITRELNQSGKGQNYAFIIALAFLLAAFFLVYTGHDAAGGAIGGIDIIGLVYVFVNGKKQQKKDLEKK